MPKAAKYVPATPQESALTEFLGVIDGERIRRECLDSFPEFVRQAWSLIDSAPLQWGWFLEIFCRECERWARGEVRNLAIAVPPGFGKSLIASVFLPTWMWAQDPSIQFLCCSHNQELANRDNQRGRTLMRSKWYDEQFVRGAWTFTRDQDQKKQYKNTLGGLRQALGGKTSLVGWRGDKLIFDDPIDVNPQKPPRREDFDSAYDWMQYIRNTRINHPKTSQTLLIMQRVDPRDCWGRVLEDEPDAWTTVCFDMEYDPLMPYRHPEDPRKVPGELLFPERVGDAEVKLRRIAQGHENYTAQNQQQPVTASGSIVSPSWFVDYDGNPRDRDLSQYDYIIGSWDCAFLAKATSSWVVGTVWGIKKPADAEKRIFDLLDVDRAHLTYTQTRTAVRRMALKWPETSVIIVEEKALGPAILDDLKGEVPNLVPFDPTPYGQKEQRLRAVASVFEAGRVRLPREAHWRDIYVREITYFPKVDEDDQVDSTTQALLGAIYHMPMWSRKFGHRAPRVYGGWD